MLIDPPEGWKYGFPREYKPLPNETAKEFCIRHGYPEKLNYAWDNHIRFVGDSWEFEKEEV